MYNIVSFRTQAIESTLRLLDTLDGWIDDIPPLPTPQRFGNLAFRTWGKRVDNVSFSYHLMVLQLS